jgi:hypothetical protein
MNVYDEVELNRIKKTSETNDKMEDFFNDKRKEWNDNVMPLFKVLSINDMSYKEKGENITSIFY